MKKVTAFLSVLVLLWLTGCAENSSDSSQAENSGYVVQYVGGTIVECNTA